MIIRIGNSGTAYQTGSKTWTASVTVNGRLKILGTDFSSFRTASKAYQMELIKIKLGV